MQPSPTQPPPPAAGQGSHVPRPQPGGRQPGGRAVKSGEGSGQAARQEGSLSTSSGCNSFPDRLSSSGPLPYLPAPTPRPRLPPHPPRPRLGRLPR